MLVRENILNSETKELLDVKLNDYFEYQEGNDLEAVIQETLNNKDIFTYLSAFLEQDKGLVLGKNQYWNGYFIYEHYGLTIDFSKIPRKISLFRYFSESEKPGIYLGNEYRTLKFVNSYGIIIDMDSVKPLPNPSKFADSLKDALQNFESRLIDLPK